MTKEEAIEFGNMWLQINEDCKDSSTYAFFQMAIKALEQEDILDKIRAEIEQRPYGVASASVITGMKYERTAILEILDKYRSESEE